MMYVTLKVMEDDFIKKLISKCIIYLMLLLHKQFFK